jgi:hypothetical protein
MCCAQTIKRTSRLFMRKVKGLAVVPCVVLLASHLLAQSFTASVRGVVTDPTQAMVPGATVTATDVQRNLNHSATTDGAGRYVFLSLPPGIYKLTAKAQGFRPFASSEFNLQVQQEATIDVSLALAATGTTVEVTATQPLLNMTSASLGQVVGNTYVRELPVVDRAFMRLAYLAPGVTPTNVDPGASNQAYPTNFVSNGVRSSTSDVLIDGVSVTSIEAGGNADNFLEMSPSLETVQEFKVQSNFFSAEFGNTGGTVVNIASKSGTNELHGSGIWYHRQAELNANSFFAKAQGIATLPDTVKNRYGFSVGGPVVLPKVYKGKNRTFFHVTLERDRELTPGSQLATVPTSRELAGDFSETLNANGILLPIYNPFDTYTSGSNVLRLPFAGNVVPKSMQDPIALNVIKYYPQPTSDGNPFTHVNNFYAQGTSASDDTEFIAKVDHVISEKQRLYVRLSREWQRGGAFYAFGKPADPFQKGPFNSDARTGVLSYALTLSPSTLIEVRVGATAQPVSNVVPSAGFDPTSLGLPAITKTSGILEFPSFGPSGYSALGTVTNAGSFRATQTENIPYSLTRIKGAHTIKVGGEVRLYKLNAHNVSSPAGSFSFSTGITGENPLVSNSLQGNGLASMLLGWGSSGSYGILAAPASSHHYWGWYAQDDWKIAPGLTLNLGLRYDIERPRTERYDRYSWFDPDMPSPLNGQVPGYNLRGGLVFAGPGQRSPFDTDWNNAQPRIGLAYALDNRTTLRAGYGLYYALSRAIVNSTLGAPFDVTTPVQWSLDGNLTRYATLANPWPAGLIAAQGEAKGAATFIGQSLGTNSRPNQNPQYQQWAFSIQRALPLNSVVEINYVGTKGTHLVFPGLQNADRLNPIYWSLGRTALNALVPNPFYGVITDPTSPLSAKTVQLSSLLRPYPQYTGLSLSMPNNSNSIYHALQMKFEKHLSRGLTAVASYTWSKMIDDSSDNGYSYLGGDSSVQDIWNLRNERSLSVMDVPYRLVTSFSYELPFGRGKALGTSWPKALNLAAGGWALSGVVTFQSGFPIVIGLTGGNLLEGTQRPNLIGDPSMPGSAEDRMNNYFNVNAFSKPAIDTIGSAPRTLNYFGPHVFNTDMNLTKKFRVREGHTVELRLEGFNALNDVVFGMPGSSFGSTTFGRITGYAGGMGPRELQVAVRYDF